MTLDWESIKLCAEHVFSFDEVFPLLQRTFYCGGTVLLFFVAVVIVVASLYKYYMY
jgi:hypothetical protein